MCARRVRYGHRGLARARARDRVEGRAAGAVDAGEAEDVRRQTAAAARAQLEPLALGLQPRGGAAARRHARLGALVDSAGGALLGVAATTFALKAAAGSQRRGAVYGAFLAAYDSGGAASGWLAVFLATKCRTAPEDPASVRRYLYVAAAAALTLPFFCVAACAKGERKRDLI